jgi:hypothetical protein
MPDIVLPKYKTVIVHGVSGMGITDVNTLLYQKKHFAKAY